MSALTAGSINEFTYTDAFEPRVADNGELRAPSAFQGCTCAQILLAASMAPISLLKADGIPAPLILVLNDPFREYDNSSRRQALMVLKEFAAANGLQLIYTTSSDDLITGNAVRI